MDSAKKPLESNDRELECKFAAYGTNPLELWGGQVGSEKYTTPQKKFK